MKNIIISMSVVFLLFGCGSASTGGSSGVDTSGTIVGNISFYDNVSALLVKYSQVQDGIFVYVDGDESLYGVTDSVGNFTINNVPSGEQCIYASAQNVSSKTYGFRSCIDVGTGSTDVGDLIMGDTGSLVGNVILVNNNINQEGTLIYAAGTSYSAYTNSDGDFTMSELPPGQYDVTVKRDNFKTKKYTTVYISSSSTTDIGTVRMISGNGEILEGAAIGGGNISTAIPSPTFVEDIYMGDLYESTISKYALNQCDTPMPNIISVHYEDWTTDNLSFKVYDQNGGLYWAGEGVTKKRTQFVYDSLYCYCDYVFSDSRNISVNDAIDPIIYDLDCRCSDFIGSYSCFVSYKN